MARKKREVTVVNESPEVEAQAEVKEIEKSVAPSQEGPIRVKVTQEELARLQGEKRLIGYDPATCEALIKGEEK